jgi:hypothetical protein
MKTVFLLKVGYLDMGSDDVGIFTSLDNAKQRAKEIAEGKTKRYRPDYFDIYSALIDVGELIHIETIKST